MSNKLGASHAVKKRGIKVVWHFTRRQNLESILEHGLISRQELEENNYGAKFSDEVRCDGHEDAICASISFPNYKMFYPKRLEFPNDDWVIIALCPSVLWKKDCGFCIDNAANAKMAKIPLQTKKSMQSFEGMFAEIEEKPTRADLGLKDLCTTNPQAEVLIFDRIEPEYIMAIICKNNKVKNELCNLFPNEDIQPAPTLYRPRFDYANW